MLRVRDSRAVSIVTCSELPAGEEGWYRSPIYVIGVVVGKVTGISVAGAVVHYSANL